MVDESNLEGRVGEEEAEIVISAAHVVGLLVVQKGGGGAPGVSGLSVKAAPTARSLLPEVHTGADGCALGELDRAAYGIEMDVAVQVYILADGESLDAAAG